MRKHFLHKKKTTRKFPDLRYEQLQGIFFYIRFFTPKMLIFVCFFCLFCFVLSLTVYDHSLLYPKVNLFVLICKAVHLLTSEKFSAEKLICNN